jgi:hypothetical protein
MQIILLLLPLLSEQHKMTSHARDMPSLPPDVLRLVFDQLEADVTSILNVGLTCHTWRSLSLPSVYRNVDLSYHNIPDRPLARSNYGNVDDLESRRWVNGERSYTEYKLQLRPANLVHRQRTFLRAITAHPKLAMYVKSLTWTLVWRDSEDTGLAEESEDTGLAEESADTGLTEVDRQTWNVFGQMKNVTKLDLASLHDVNDDDFVRQSPSQLFPAVVDLKLVGWMHRGLVKAIFASLNTARLRSLTLDYAQDEGALPDGSPMGSRFAEWCCSKLGGTMENPTVISQTLLDRRESGKAFIFPGPMWLPLHILSTARLDSLTQLRVEVPPLSDRMNQQNYLTLFHKTADLLKAASATLRSLVVVLDYAKVYPHAYGRRMCGTGRGRMLRAYRVWCLEMASSYLYQLVTVLSEESFPLLEHIRFEGFHELEFAFDRNAGTVAHVERTREAIRKCPFAAMASFTENPPSGNERPIFNGHREKVFPGHPDEWEKVFEDMLNASF